MPDMTNTLMTGNPELLQSRLDRKQMLDMIGVVADRGKNITDGLSTELTNKFNQLTTELATVRQQALTFDKPETEKLEEAFVAFLGTSGVTNMLSSMGVTLNGTAYSMASVMDALLNADKIVSREVLAEDADGLPSSVRYTLHDGYVVTVPYARTDDAIAGTTTIKGETTDWHGLTAVEEVVFTKTTATKQLFGAPYESIQFNLKKSTNFTFDLTNLLTEATAVTSAAPDLDADGIIGTPPAGG